MEKALSQSAPPAYGVSTIPELGRSKAFGQPHDAHDANYVLLYSLYKLNVDVGFGVYAGEGTASANWHLDSADEQGEPTGAQYQEMAEISAWLRQPHPLVGVQGLPERVLMYRAISGWLLYGVRGP